MARSSQRNGWQLQCHDPAAAPSDRRGDVSEPRSSRPPSPSNRSSHCIATVVYKTANLSLVVLTTSMTPLGPALALLAETQRSVVSSRGLITLARDAPRPVENVFCLPVGTNDAGV